MIAVMLAITLASYAIGWMQYRGFNVLLGLWWTIVIVIAFVTLSRRNK